MQEQLEELPEQTKGDELELLDGGVAYNNPAMHMVYKALNSGVEMEDIFILSLGTGKQTYEGRQIDENLYWEEQRTGHCISRQTEDTHSELEEMFPDANYVRIQPFLEHKVDFDATDEQSLMYLYEKAFQVMNQNKDAMDAVVKHFVDELHE